MPLSAHTLMQQEGVRERLGYLCKREALMQYPHYRKLGWPLGSGIVESANKVVVEARLKGAGMHWEASHVNPMLTLRNAVCNERWQETWDHITRQQRRQRLVQRKQRAQARWHQRLSRLMLVLLRWRLAVKKPTPACRRPVAPAATLPGSSRPSAHHPWKRTPACRPKPRAKT